MSCLLISYIALRRIILNFLMILALTSRVDNMISVCSRIELVNSMVGLIFIIIRLFRRIMLRRIRLSSLKSLMLTSRVGLSFIIIC